jgi:hypothetical protein
MEPELLNENEDPEDAKKRVEAADPFEKRLKPITLDSKVKGGLPSWTVRFCGETSTFQHPNPT